jgi:hypothetical protein
VHTPQKKKTVDYRGTHLESLLRAIDFMQIMVNGILGQFIEF